MKLYSVKVIRVMTLTLYNFFEAFINPKIIWGCLLVQSVLHECSFCTELMVSYLRNLEDKINSKIELVVQ